VHDLKNLAGRLAALGQNLQEHYEDPLFKETARDLLADTVQHLKRLASDLRDHEGRVVIKLRIDINQALSDALLDTRPDLVPNLRLNVEFSQLPQVWGDAYLLRLAVARAIENALAAMGGSAGVLSARTRLERRRAKAFILVDIEDNGPGMSEEFVRERLFQPYITTKDEGLGLGAYTIRQVAALHGGSVRVSSVEGAGTRIRFRLPVDDT